MAKLRVGIAGAGYIGNVHASILARDERVAVAAVYDVVSERAVRLAQSAGALATESADNLLDKVDALYIATPNTRHTELALEALKNGKHVFCEKPMATGVEQARKIVASAKSSPAVFQVGHNRRFAPVYVALKETLEKRGPAHSAHIKMNRGEVINPPWVADPETTGGFLFETTIHMFDIMRFLFGEVRQIDAVGSRHEYAEVDDFSVLLKFASGFHATLASSSDASWLFPFERIEVFCHHSTVVTREMESITTSEALDGSSSTRTMHLLSKEEKWGYVQEDRAFVDSAIEGKPPAVTAEDGLKSVELVEAVYEAVKSGERVNLDR